VKPGTQPGTQAPRPRVWIHYSPVYGAVEVRGDTYPVKESLKAMGFKWRDGAWVKEGVAPSDALRIAGELERIADVSVSPLKDAVESLVRVIELISTVSSRLDGDLARELEGVQSRLKEIAGELRGLQERVDKRLLGG